MTPDKTGIALKIIEDTDTLAGIVENTGTVEDMGQVVLMAGVALSKPWPRVRALVVPPRLGPFLMVLDPEVLSQW